MILKYPQNTQIKIYFISIIHQTEKAGDYHKVETNLIFY